MGSMPLSERDLRAALAFSIIVPALQVGRVILWGYWPPLREVPIDADGYLAGAFQLATALLARRRPAAAPALLAASWGIDCGMLYRTFTEQLADANRHAGHEVLVIAVKGVLLAASIAALARVLHVQSARAHGGT